MKVKLPNLHPGGQYQAHINPARFKVLATGTRWGKTLMGSEKCFQVAAVGGNSWWVAPSYKLAKPGWDLYMKPWALEINQHANKELIVIRFSDKELHFPGGGILGVRSADDPDSLRGWPLDFVVLDECAFMKSDAWFAALRPRLTDRKGGAMFFSTPKGKNWFFDLHNEAKDREDWESWRFPSASNPFLDPEEIENARRTMPDRLFRQEYMAEFLEDAGGVFRKIQEAAIAEVQEEPIKGHSYAVGADWGRTEDFTVVVVVDLSLGSVVNVDRYTGVPFAIQLGRFRTLMDTFRPIAVTPETNSFGMPLVEQLDLDGYPIWPPEGFKTTNATKAAALNALALAFEQKTITIPPASAGPQYAQLIMELESYEETRTPLGMLKFGVPEGKHDDCVMATILAWTNMGEGGDFITVIGVEDEEPKEEEIVQVRYSTPGDKPGAGWDLYIDD